MHTPSPQHPAHRGLRRLRVIDGGLKTLPPKYLRPLSSTTGRAIDADENDLLALARATGVLKEN